MNSIFNDIKSNFKTGSSFTRLLYVNLGVFLIIKILSAFGFLFKINDVNHFIESYLSLPSNLSELVKKPWTLISYMFVHQDFLHILFNMVWLHFGSKLFLQYFNGKQLLSTYFLGGIFGGLIYISAFNIFPVFQDAPFINSVAIGASASVLAIFIAIATYSPNYIVNLTFIGNTFIKHIAIFLVVLDFLLIEKNNPGGHIAHLGGAIFGFLYINLLRKGVDLSVNFYTFLSYFKFSEKNKLKKVHKKRSSKNNDDIFRNKKSDKQKKINSILEKISKSGYDSLTKEEKELLFKESK
ncbi:MAG: rhomboid family intramembrane serine protease [Flavobacteriales bacterium]|nr:rhomboid family intramembrane serine protease [Flavobacteriales bacterium]